MLSRLFVALARIMRYREHIPSALPSADQASEPTGTSEFGSDELIETLPLELRPVLGWQRLELNAKTGLPAPSSDTYFSFLYCL